jgi:hypothetical protein
MEDVGRTLIQEYRWMREDGTVIGDHVNVDFHEDGMHITIKGLPFRYEVVGDMPDLNTGRKIVSTKERPLLIPYPGSIEVSVSPDGTVSVFSRP